MNFRCPDELDFNEFLRTPGAVDGAPFPLETKLLGASKPLASMLVLGLDDDEFDRERCL